MRVSGTAKAVAGDDGQLFLNSFCIHPDRMPEAALAPKPADPVDKPANPQPAAPQVTAAKVQPSGETEMVSGGFDTPFRDYGPQGGMLVGFEAGMGKLFNRDAVTALKPIFRTKAGESFGAQQGKGGQHATVKAKEGYAVGAIKVQRGLFIEGFSLVYMKVEGGKLNPGDTYESEWTGDAAKRADLKLDGNGQPFIGLVAKVHTRTNEMTGFALILNTPGAIESRRIWTTGTPTEILGGNHHPVFRDLAPEGGHLVGLELGVAALGTTQNIRGVRPIYLTGDKESLGNQYGTQFQRTVTLRAKAGYAIGAVTVTTFAAAEGLSVTYMKIGKNGLDTTSTYESEWVGFSDKRKPQTVSGKGKKVIGITGKHTDRECVGIGLVLQDDKK